MGTATGTLKVGDRVRLVASDAGWKAVTSLSESFVTFDGVDTAPVSRRVLARMMAEGRVDVLREAR